MILLDTHTLIWWVSGSKELSSKARAAIQREKGTGLILVSSISVWEIYMLVQKNRLQLGMDTDIWFSKIESLPFVQFVHVDNNIAKKSVTLPGEFNLDPADRIIVATAREKGAVVVTADKSIGRYKAVKTIW